MASASTTNSSTASGSVGSLAASASVSGSQDVVGVVSKTESSNAGDSCTWYADGECLRPRSCADCLNVLISSDSCAIDPDGACVGSSEYETYVNSQAYFIPSYKYYPSSSYSYCASSDTTCAACIAGWSGKSSASVSGSDVCTGQDGCICLAACEVTDRVATILSEQDCSGDDSSGSGSSLSSTERILVAIAVGASVGFFCYALIWLLRRFMTIRRRRQLGPLLNLNGWKSLQQKLVDSERAQLSREPGIAQCESADEPTAPTPAASTAAPSRLSVPVMGEATQTFEEQDELPVMGTMLAAVGGPAVVVEHGDAYRPLSPSRMNARQA